MDLHGGVKLEKEPNKNQSPSNIDFQPSKLGTKEYWDHAYERELECFRESGDTSEVWFGKESMDRIRNWLEKQNIPKDVALLDIGTGNGELLVELAKAGFTNLSGIDNSSTAVELAKAVAEKEELLSLKLQVADFLHPFPCLSHYEICIDKGTFDAISLSFDHPGEKLRRYHQSLLNVLKNGGLFLITSCNWTKQELVNHFNEGLELLEELPTPKFHFGGKTGSSVTVLVFKRKE
ncbi:EEF1A lysine methyltransferase 2 [Pristis pectinata]|uniref:EEF1A lysine methyltransferase 2 n=1 Tax=Pristis pectinata TaxID=685728 RepID=UPI00223E2F86|nr:EEF1A lysine methyltransferase 2 [Pristis pectinata]